MTTPTPGPQPQVLEKLISWSVEPDHAGERLDRAISAYIVDLSRSYSAQLIEKGEVTVNGKPVTKPSHKVREGDRVVLRRSAPQPSGLRVEDIALNVVYEDADLLVIDKPAGMVVHPAPGHSGGTVVNALLAHVPELEFDMGDEARPGIVHRLDKDTSGLLVVAKRRAAHEALSRQMAERLMHKEYLAVVRGTPRALQGVVDAPIARDPRDRKRMAIVPGGRAARTHFAIEKQLDGYALVRATLETGRTHQIRVHMASIGHAILGDPLYGKSTLKDAASLGLSRQFLHAHKLGFALPSSGEWREFRSELPEELRKALEKLERGDEATTPFNQL